MGVESVEKMPQLLNRMYFIFVLSVGSSRIRKEREENHVSKVPYIERPYLGVGLTGECAYLWACFLANEADMEDDYTAYDKFKAMAEQLAPKDGKPVPASVHYPALEEAIGKCYGYHRKRFTHCSE